MRAAFYTLGCKVNQYETQILMQAFASKGYDVVEPEDGADIFVVNSCTVTASGDKKTKQVLRRFRRQNPGAALALTGCFPQAFPDDASVLSEADIITGAKNRDRLLCLVEAFLSNRERVVEITPHERGEGFEAMQAASFHEHTRAFVKIEDGCDRRCSYCIIPTARGPVRSKKPEDLRQELSVLGGHQYREAVLVGINLSSYGKDLGLRLADAVELACAEPGIARIRLGSLEPELLTDEDISRMAKQPKLCPQFHLSLQSGCDKTLREMNRHYTSAQYRDIVQKLRRAFPGCAITTDVMVGFPGETDADFAESLAFVRETAFARVHVFAYSRRESTRAAAMPDQVPKAQKERRSREIIALASSLHHAFLQEQVGTVQPVLFETLLPDGRYEGLTPTYCPVRVLSGEDLRGTSRDVNITGYGPDACEGNLL